MGAVEAVKKAMLCMTRQCWEQGILAQALLEMEEYDLLELVVHDIVLRQSADGRLCNIESAPAVVDSSFNIMAVAAVAQRTGNEEYRAAAQRNVDYLLQDAPRSEQGMLYHMISGAEVWADSAAFMPAVLALYGHPAEAMRQMRDVCARLYDEKTGLYFHTWDDDAQKYLRQKLWSVGNGWILTGLLRLALCLPSEAKKEREETIDMFVRLLDNMLAHKTEGDMFHDILDDVGSFVETEGTEMVAYAIFKAVGHGLLPAEYLPSARAMRKAVQARVQANGLVTGCASSPDFTRPGTSVEGQAHYLMMEQACCALEKPSMEKASV